MNALGGKTRGKTEMTSGEKIGEGMQREKIDKVSGRGHGERTSIRCRAGAAGREDYKGSREREARGNTKRPLRRGDLEGR